MADKTGSGRMIVADVDGTVVGEPGTVSDAAVAAVARACAAGWHVALATGRMLDRTRPIAARLGVPWVICTEGSLIYSLAAEKRLQAHPVRSALIAQALGELNRASWPYALATPRNLYARSTESACLFAPWADSVEAIPGRDEPDAVLMLVVFGPYQEMRGLYGTWAARFGRQVQLVLEHTGAVPDGGLVKMLSPSADKGQSALWLASYLGLTQRDLVAFGDWLNDIPLLKCAALSIVPDNAVAEVKALADHVSPYNVGDDFFARELNRLLDERD